MIQARLMCPLSMLPNQATEALSTEQILVRGFSFLKIVKYASMRIITMKRKEKTEPMNISVPASLKRQIQEHPEINWSALASKTFDRQLRAQNVLDQLVEEGVSEDEATVRALRVQHHQKVLKKVSQR